MNQTSRATERRLSGRLALLLRLAGLAALGALAAGCVTTAVVKDATGTPARLMCRLLETDGPEPLITCREEPEHRETLVVVDAPIAGCQRHRVFVNPMPGAPNELSTSVRYVQPLSLDTEAQELRLWERLPDEPCAVLLFAGRILETGFTGMSLSTRAAPQKRIALQFQADDPASRAAWLALMVAPYYDVIVTPLFGLAATAATADATSDQPFSHPVTLSFDFPDGSRKETTLTYHEGQAILKQHFPYLFSAMAKEWEDVRFWTRAALFKLRLDFREELNVADGTRTIYLTHVGGYSGDWEFDPRDGRGLTRNIEFPVQDARYIRYRLEEGAIAQRPGAASQAAAERTRALRASAEEGDAQAQWELYLFGGRRRQDWVWLCRAADQKQVNAVMEVGDLHWEGREGLSVDRVRAYAWYSVAAARDYEPARSELMLGRWVMSDSEIERAKRRAGDWAPGRCKAELMGAEAGE